MREAGAAHGTGRAFLTDFGLARDTATGSRFTRTGTTLGTPAYMPPEQARGEVASLTPAGDVWALGCVLYEAVAGRRAFDGAMPAEVVAAVLTREPARLRALRPDAPAGVERVVRACLAKAPGARPADAAALRDDCRRVLAGARPLARPPCRRRWPAAAAVLVVVGALGTGGILASSQRAAAPTPVSPAMAPAEALARQAHALRQSEPREAARLLGEALALHEHERPADEAGRAAWRLERGLLLWAVGEGPEARIEWGRIPLHAPDAQRARLCCGLEAFFRIAGAEALPDLEAVASGAGAEARIARGAVAAAQERWAAARDALAAAEGWAAALLRGYVEGRDPAGDPAAAVRAYDDALADGITFAWALHNRGVQRSAQGDVAGAVEDYGRALEIDPALASAYHNRGNARQDQGDPGAAIADYSRALAINPDFAVACYSRGALRYAAGDVAGAITDYDRVLDLDPRCVEAFVNRGLARRDQRDLAGAIADCNCAIALNPRLAEAYVARGSALLASGDIAAALTDCERALVLNPRHAEAFVMRGSARRQQGNFTGAVLDYDRALELNPRLAMAYNNRGNARWEQGDLAGAIADFERAVPLYPPESQDRRMAEENLARARAELAARDG